MPVYQFVKIPTSLNIVVAGEFDNLDDAKIWAKNNLDTSTRWIIRLDGRNISEAFTFTKYNAIYSDKVEIKTFNHNYKHPQYFDTKDEALNDRKKHQNDADIKLGRIDAKIYEALMDDEAELSYVMEGDTYGIYEDYMYIGVYVKNYYFKKRIDK